MKTLSFSYCNKPWKPKKRVCIRTPLELGKAQKAKIKKKFRKRLFLSNFRNFFGARGGTWTRTPGVSTRTWNQCLFSVFSACAFSIDFRFLKSLWFFAFRAFWHSGRSQYCCCLELRTKKRPQWWQQISIPSRHLLSDPRNSREGSSVNSRANVYQAMSKTESTFYFISLPVVRHLYTSIYVSATVSGSFLIPLTFYRIITPKTRA